MAKKKNTAKPVLGAKFKDRTEGVEVKFGFANALEFSYTNEELTAINTAFEQADEGWEGKGHEHYLGVNPDNADIVVCLVRTFVVPEDENEEDPTAGYQSKGVKASLVKRNVPVELHQDVVWGCKCEAAPNNQLKLRLSKDQWAEMEDDTPYLFIGILQKQWSKKISAEGVKPVKYDNKDVETEGYYEGHTLSLIDFIG